MDIFDRILSFEFDINQQNTDGRTPLMVAVQYSTPEIVKILLTEGADRNIRDDQGYRAEDLIIRSPKIRDLLGISEEFNDD